VDGERERMREGERARVKGEGESSVVLFIEREGEWEVTGGKRNDRSAINGGSHNFVVDDLVDGGH
jgi:hypothetical protein